MIGKILLILTIIVISGFSLNVLANNQEIKCLAKVMEADFEDTDSLYKAIEDKDECIEKLHSSWSYIYSTFIVEKSTDLYYKVIWWD